MRFRAIPTAFRIPDEQKRHHNVRETKLSGRGLLGQQLLADGIERIDTLVQEIRHLQTNLIYSMRFSALHRVLRYEESYIFGGVELDSVGPDSENISWGEFLFDRGLEFEPGLERLISLGDIFVPVLPKAQDAFEIGSDGDIDEMVGSEHGPHPWLNGLIDYGKALRRDTAPIVRELRRRSLNGDWDDTFQMNYELFLALQVLKREVVVNKLFLCWHGIQAFGMKKEEYQDEFSHAMGAFFFVRSVVLQNVRLHVERLADFHAQFEKTLDIGSQENHRPITGRRREQGLYHHVLSEQTKETFVQATDIIANLLNLTDEHRNKVFNGLPVVVHRWQHNSTSQNAETASSMRSMRLERKGNNPVVRPYFSAFAINTSFWMPDRPDLQPVIAHEAAHCVMAEVFGDLGETAFVVPQGGVLGRTTRDLLAATRRVQQEYNLSEQHEPTQDLVRELMADAIGLAVSGPSYLFALFQEIFAYGAEHVAGDPRQRAWRNLRLAHLKSNQTWGTSRVDVNWYLRLMTCADLLEDFISEDEDSALTEILIEGVRACCDTMFKFLRYRLEQHQVHFSARLEAQRLAIRQCLYQSSFGRSVAQYREAQANHGKVDAEKGTEQATSLFYRFPEDVRRNLAEYFIERKATSQGRVIRTTLGALAVDGLDTDERRKLLDGNRKLARFVKKMNLPEKTSDGIVSSIRSDADVGKLAVCLFDQFFISGERASAPKKNATLSEHIGKLPIFGTFSDIGWQACLVRSGEVLQTCIDASSTSGNFCLIQTLSADCSPGRETMQVALELLTHHRRSVTTDLAEACRRVQNILEIPSGSSPWNLTGIAQAAPFEKLIDIFERENNQADVEATKKVQDTIDELKKTKLLDWLGSNIDADFAELALLQKLRPTKPDEIERFEALAAQPEMRQLLASVIKGLRFFENSLLCQVFKDRRNGSLKLDVRNLGALQLLKADRGYPNFDFRYAPQDVILKSDAGSVIKTFSDLTEVRGPFTIVTAFRDKIRKIVSEAAADCLELPFGDSDAGRVELLVNSFLSERLRKLRLHGDLMSEMADDALKHNRFRQDLLRPVHAREPNEIELRLTYENLVREKIAELESILEPVADVWPEIGGLVSLAAHAKDAVQRNSIVGDAFSSLSKKMPGLNRFQTLVLTRQSLIHAHWWREQSGPARKSELDLDVEKWKHERTQHASQYFELAPRTEDLGTDGALEKDCKQAALRKFATLGRYDYFSVGSDVASVHMRNPVTDARVSEKLTDTVSSPRTPFSRFTKETQYRSYFERRERALHFGLGLGEPLDLTAPHLAHQGKPKDILCFLTIRLARRSERLGFLKRLRTARALSWSQEPQNGIFGERLYRQQIGLRLIESLQANPHLQIDDHALKSTLAKESSEAALQQLLETLGNANLDMNDLPRSASGRLGGDPFLGALVDMNRYLGDLPDIPLECTGPFLLGGDSALLGEGWADVILALQCDAAPENDNERLEWVRKGHQRLYDIFALQNILFQDPEVYRTEMFLRPAAIPFAAYPGPTQSQKRFQISLSIRAREDREIQGLIHNTVSDVRKQIGKQPPNVKNEITLGHIPGRNDLEVIFSNLQGLRSVKHAADPKALHIMPAGDTLEFLNDLAGASRPTDGGGLDEVVSRIGFQHFV